jgi:hypothetical protein
VIVSLAERSGRSTVTVLLRVLGPAASEGEVVGHAEVVDTGERVPLRDVDDLFVLLRRLAG